MLVISFNSSYFQWLKLCFPWCLVLLISQSKPVCSKILSFVQMEDSFISATASLGYTEQKPVLLQALPKAWGRRDGDPFCCKCLLHSLVSTAWGWQWPRTCDISAPSTQRPPRVTCSSDICSAHPVALVQTSSGSPPPLPAVPVDAHSPLFSSVSKDFQISDAISSYFVCYLLR